jgi:hypothetical protein
VPDSKSQTKSQCPQTPGHARTLPAAIAAARWHVRLFPASSSHAADFVYKRGVTGSNQVAPTKYSWPSRRRRSWVWQNLGPGAAVASTRSTSTRLTTAGSALFPSVQGGQACPSDRDRPDEDRCQSQAPEAALGTGQRSLVQFPKRESGDPAASSPGVRAGSPQYAGPSCLAGYASRRSGPSRCDGLRRRRTAC